MSFSNGVLTYVPTCSRVPASDANLPDSAQFLPDQISYYTDQIYSMVPGFVLGGICAVGFILSLVWICVRFAKRRKFQKNTKPEVTETDQFLTTTAEGGPPTLSVPPEAHPRKQARNRKVALWLTALVLFFGVATVAFASWGMGESIQQTDNTISDFWDIWGVIEQIVNSSVVELQSLSYHLALLGNSTVVLVDQVAQQSDALVTLLDNSRLLPPGEAQRVVDLATSLPADRVGNAAQAINDTAVPAMQDLLNLVVDVYDYKDPTMSIQDKWRFVVLAVLFGLVILAALITTPLVFYMRYGRWTSFAVAVTWLLMALVTLLGAGALSGTKVYSADSCLYMETFMYHVADTKLSPDAGKIVRGVFDYYFGVANLTDATDRWVNDTITSRVDLNQYDPALAEAIVDQLSKVTLGDVLNAVEQLQDLLTVVSHSQELAAAARDLGVSNTTLGALQGVGLGVSGVLNDTLDVVNTLRRASVVPTYHGFKSYLCCGVYDTIYLTWVSWVCCGVVGLVYCLLCSARVVWQTMHPQFRGWCTASACYQAAEFQQGPAEPPAEATDTIGARTLPAPEGFGSYKAPDVELSGTASIKAEAGDGASKQGLPPLL